MGKKSKKKGRGIEKTAIKTEKKLSAKHKKYLAKIGEDDIEKILAQIKEEEKKKVQIKEVTIIKPTRRANFSFVSHPLKDELFLFGGEFFNGQKTVVFNDLLNYNINKNEWKVIQTPNTPPPRCGHQMVAVTKEKGQLWLFGGEFTSPTQNQFYHYKDLWVFHLESKNWENIICPNGPSARSGHRMVLSKNQLFVFGGYHDNSRDYKYFNDIYTFNLENYKWNKLEPLGNPPPPRSGCQMIPLNDGKILIAGGYCKEKIKKDVDKGVIYSDMFVLTPDKSDTSGTKWKWVSHKQGGFVPTPRSGCTMVLGHNNKAYSFGGVFDVEESEEDIKSVFFNDFNMLDLEKKSWKQLSLSGKKISEMKVKKNEKLEELNENLESMEDVVEEPKVTVINDGVFTMTIKPAAPTNDSNFCSTNFNSKSDVFLPSPRMNCGLTIKGKQIYLFGGLFEDDDKQFTLADMYSLDLHKLDEWKVILKDDEAKKEWIPSDSDSGSDENEDEDDNDSDDDVDDDDDEDNNDDNEDEDEDNDNDDVDNDKSTKNNCNNEIEVMQVE